MKLFMYEAYKVFAKPLLLIIFAVILIINMVVIYNTPREASENQIVYNQISSMEEDEKFEFLERKVTTLTEEYELFEKELEESGSYSYYLDYESYITGDARGDARLYSQVYTEAERTVEYDLYLEEVIASAENLKNFAIFADTDSFDYKNTVKAVEEYKKLEGINPIIQSSNGMNLAVGNIVSVVFLLLLTVLFTISLVSEDIESGMAWLVKSTKNGREKTVYTRLMLLLAFSTTVSVIICGSNFVMGDLLLGLGDLSAPIQSVDTFYSTWLNLSILEYILIQFALAILATVFVGLITFFICTKLANAMLSYFALFTLLVIEFLAYVFIPQNSYINVFKYVNIFVLLEPKTIIASYVSLNFFSYPVSIILVLSAVYILGFVATLFFLLKETKKTKNKLVIKINYKPKWYKKKYTYSLFLTEVYKLFIVNKVIYMLLALIVYAWYTMDSYQTYYDQADAIKKSYITQVEGKINAETLAFIEEEEARFQKMDDVLEEHAQKLEDGEITDEEYNYLSMNVRNWDEHRMIFSEFKSEVDALDRQNLDSIVYKTGYNKILGTTATGNMLRLNIFGIAFLMLFITPSYAADNNKGMSKLINATIKGKKVLLTKKIIITVMVSFLVCSLSFVPYMVRTIELYGGWQIHENIRYLFPYVFDVSILVGIILTVFWYCILYAIVGVAMLFISKYSKRSITSIIIASVTFVIPSILLFLASGGVSY